MDTPEHERVAVIVGDRSADPLVASAVRWFAARRIASHLIRPDRLAATPLHIDGTQLSVDGRDVAIVLFRCQPSASFGDDFADRDADFAAAEARAIWLHALNLPNVAVVNRFDDETWYTAPDWPVWRRRSSRNTE